MTRSASHVATFRIPVDASETADRIERVLAVEAEETPERSRVRVTAESDAVVIQVEADDASSLRAATNSILRLAIVAADLEAGETFKP